MKVNRIVAFVISAFVFSMLLPSALHAQKPVKKTSSASDPQKIAKTWLSLIGSRKYGGSYDAGSKSFKQEVTKEQWVDAMKQVRKQTGSLKSRSLLKGQRLTTLPNMPPGNYAVLQYKSAFARMPKALETVMLEQESDKKWRVNGYFVKPR